VKPKPKRVVSLKNLADLKGIKTEGKSVHIGATTTLGELIANSAVQEHFPALIAAAKNILSPQLLTLGTVGGELLQRPRCWYYRNGLGLFGNQVNASQVELTGQVNATAHVKQTVSLIREGDNRYHAIFGNDGPALFVHPSSLAPVFVALGANMIVAGAKGKKREVAAAKFFQIPKGDQDRESALQPNEILAGIEVPIRGLKNAIYEVRHRQTIDWPYVTAAVAFASKGGSVSDARVVLGHVAPIPWVSQNAAKALNGATISESSAAKAGEAATQGAKPLSKNQYKIQLVRTAVKRAALAAGA
jgi:xanthine dehydrogenase YagS FAD-binding subunit